MQTQNKIEEIKNELIEFVSGIEPEYRFSNIEAVNNFLKENNLELSQREIDELCDFLNPIYFEIPYKC